MSVSPPKNACSNCGNEVQPDTEHRAWQMGRCEIFRDKKKVGFSNRATWPKEEPGLKPDQGEQ